MKLALPLLLDLSFLFVWDAGNLLSSKEINLTNSHSQNQNLPKDHLWCIFVLFFALVCFCKRLDSIKTNNGQFTRQWTSKPWTTYIQKNFSTMSCFLVGKSLSLSKNDGFIMVVLQQQKHTFYILVILKATKPQALL